MVDTIDDDIQTPQPGPLVESPPNDRWCDIVMKGGVASGIVYPWAILEIARKYRLRNLGGTSVGAMAAAIAAACEYGRRQGQPNSFEVLRQLPTRLANPPDESKGVSKRTRMLSLFQPAESGERLFSVFVEILDKHYENEPSRKKFIASHLLKIPCVFLKKILPPPIVTFLVLFAVLAIVWVNFGILKSFLLFLVSTMVLLLCVFPLFSKVLKAFFKVYFPSWPITLPLLLIGLLLAASGYLEVLITSGCLEKILTLRFPETIKQVCSPVFVSALGTHEATEGASVELSIISGVLITILVFFVLLLVQIAIDIKNGIVKNDLGLCRGSSQDTSTGSKAPALVEWIHEAIQRAAGRSIDAAPLTFADLWHAPLWSGGASPALHKNGSPIERSINLEMITTNVTQGRPYRLPLVEGETQLFYSVKQWRKFFPDNILNPLIDSSNLYQPHTDSNAVIINDLYELPRSGLPIVVAARLSLSFPLLFSTIPLYAIDNEEPRAQEPKLRLCRFSDGGLCSNFPIHFFDSPLPRWPTFGLSLEERESSNEISDGSGIWLPTSQEEGKSDSWYRIDPIHSDNGLHDSNSDSTSANHTKTYLPSLGKFLWSAFLASKDWRDRTAIKMPHVRRRVVRLRLVSKDGEGQLNIGMPKKQILHMASCYGTASGKKLCEEFAPSEGQLSPTEAWREHVWTRLHVLIGGLSDLLRNFDNASTSEGHTLNTNNLLQEATLKPPISSLNDSEELSDAQRVELRDLINRIAELEYTLATSGNYPHSPDPLPELRLRPPL